MERTFIIGNFSQNHKISEGNCCWKDKEDCNINSVMHKFHWNPLDNIYTASIDSYYIFKFDSKLLQMKKYNINLMNDSICPELLLTHQYYDDINDIKKYAFLMEKNKIKLTHDHIPIWTTEFFVIYTIGDNGILERSLRKHIKCVICGYIYNSNELDKCKNEYKDTIVFFDIDD